MSIQIPRKNIVYCKFSCSFLQKDPNVQENRTFVIILTALYKLISNYKFKKQF